MKISHTILLVVLVTSIATVGTITGLVFAPGSPGFPYLSPTYQAEKASFQQQSQNSLGTVYEVWYIQPKTGDTNTSLIIVLSSNSPNTHLYGVSTAGVNSPYGNFSATIGTGKTWLVLPAASCPIQPDPTYTESVFLLADSPVGDIVFSFKCTQAHGTVVLGNPHIIISKLVHSSVTEYLTFGHPFPSSTNVTFFVQNTGSTTIYLLSYTVNDSNRNYWQNQAWTLAVTPWSTVALNIAIGSGPGGCGSVCSYTGTPGAFNTFNTSLLGTSYTVRLFTARNNVFSIQV